MKNDYDFDKRFMIVNAETGEVLDDAQGWGYKSAENAYRAFYYKQNRSSIESKKNKIKKWITKHPEFESDLEDVLFQYAKYDDKMTGKDVEEMAKTRSLELPCDGTTFLRYF